MLPAEQGYQQIPGYSQCGQHRIFSGKPVEIQVSKTAELPSSFLKLLAYLVAIHDPLCSEEQRTSI